MLELVAVVVVAIVAFGAGVFLGPHLTGTAAAVQSSHAVSKAKSLLASEEARLKSLEAARKLVASQPTGTTGTSGAKVTAAVTGPTGA